MQKEKRKRDWKDFKRDIKDSDTPRAEKSLLETFVDVLGPIGLRFAVASFIRYSENDNTRSHPKTARFEHAEATD